MMIAGMADHGGDDGVYGTAARLQGEAPPARFAIASRQLGRDRACRRTLAARRPDEAGDDRR
ncbi:hypothetical protein DN402_13105 [Streptomyces sp. SW4]|nr:hypothetical protein DN402_13105 [Streptomyces sp. SW4]